MSQPWTLQGQIANELSFTARGLYSGGRFLTGAISRPFKWVYDAVSPTNKRKNPTGVLRSEDRELNQAERAKLTSAGRDLHRNFALLGWAVRKHLDYVSTFTFQAKGKDDKKNAQLEAFIEKWSRKENFDVARRHTLRRFLRLAEQRRTIDGDVFIYKLNTGKVQAIEGDRIRNPGTVIPDLTDLSLLIHGILVDDAGGPVGYSLCRRVNGGPAFVFEDLLEAKHVYHHAYWDRFDQTRGISPLSSVYNALTDLYESFDYALAKMKISQLLGLIFYREVHDSLGEEENTVGELDADGNVKPKYVLDIGKSPFKVELDPGDRAEFLESKNPSSEFQSFSQTMIALVLKAFDIPYSFYAENFSTYSGSRQALLQYEQSADTRRSDNRDLLNDLTAWRLKVAIDEEDPDVAGLTLDDLRWEWVSAALPWIDPMKEVAANAAAVDRGFTSTPAVCKEQGKDAFEIAKEQADHERRVMDYRVGIGLPPLPASNPVTYTELVTAQGAPNATAA